MLRPFLEKTFHLTENNTTIRTEALAGLTTFMTMSYIIFVQPAVLSTTGMDFQAVLVVTSIMLVRRSRGAILSGILTSTLLGLIFGIVRFHGLVSAPPSIAPIAFKLDILGALKLGAVPVIFIFFFLDLFDSIGSLIGIAEQGGFMRNGQLPRAREALLADDIGSSVSGLLGNSSVVSCTELAARVPA